MDYVVYRRQTDGVVMGFGEAGQFEMSPDGCTITTENGPPLMPPPVPRKGSLELRLDALEADVVELKGNRPR